MQSFLVISLLISVIAVIFALQNAVPVMVNFLFWQFSSSLALVLILAFCIGAVISSLASVPYRIKSQRLILIQQKRIREMENSVTEDKEFMKPSKMVH
jgi:uncharacterized integral membrane protein